MASELHPNLEVGMGGLPLTHSLTSKNASPNTINHPLATTDPLLNTGEVEEDDEEPFTYPGSNSSEPPSPKFQYEPSSPISSPVIQDLPPVVETSVPPSVSISSHPTPAHLEAIATAASTGDLERLQTLFQSIVAETGAQAFALANDAAQRTGQTALHVAASRGHLQTVQWLVHNCGAMADLEDKEGETAVHKAAVHGRLDVVKYLLTLEVGKADVHAQDADGWTALHNACSKGYLDIVRWLCEKGGAAEVIEPGSSRGVDRKSKGGWTPLMNAASKGHLPIVLYLLTKQNADPLVRNNWGETAYDAAAAVFEVWICEVLQRAEAERWQGSTANYDPLAVHTTLPLVLHEYQKLDARLKTIAVNGGRPKFSASGLGRRGRKSPFELRLPNADSRKPLDTPAWRSDVQLPFLEAPFVLPSPESKKDGPSREGAERSHFWLSDWTLDLTHPKVDVNEGWQYARSLNEPDEQWSAQIPPPLERALSGSGVVAGLGASGSSSPRGSGSSSTTWARRRRWIRVMRRRLDVPPLPFLQPDGSMCHLADDGTLVPYAEEPGSMVNADVEAQELEMVSGAYFSSSKDYVSRARYLAGSQKSSPDVYTPGSSRGTLADVKRTLNKLERAVNELKTGMQGDTDAERRTQAEVLLNVYTRELERLRANSNAHRPLSFSEVAEEDEAYDSDESFHYPSQSPSASIRAPSVRSQNVDYFSRPSASRVPTDLTPQLSQAPEFRVPTHEAPQKVRTPRWTPPTAHQVHPQWERDDSVIDCRSCKRRFTFLFRKHCRRCGRIFCDRCSSHRALLDPSDIVSDPAYPETPGGRGSYLQRVCEPCYDENSATVPSPLRATRSGNMEGIVVNQSSLAIPGHSREASSQLSDLADCPVCGQNLADLGPAYVQESHVKNCLDGGGRSPGGLTQAGKYIVYKLPPESSLIGDECVICLEEFAKASLVARMSCLCTFHNSCLSAWLQRGRSCPVHARDT